MIIQARTRADWESFANQFASCFESQAVVNLKLHQAGQVVVAIDLRKPVDDARNATAEAATFSLAQRAARSGPGGEWSDAAAEIDEALVQSTNVPPVPTPLTTASTSADGS